MFLDHTQRRSTDEKILHDIEDEQDIARNMYM